MRTIYTLLFAAVGFLLGAFLGGWITRGALGAPAGQAQGIAISAPGVYVGGVLGIVLGFILAKHLLHTEIP